MHDSARVADLAEGGRERVRRNFLIPRMVGDDIAAYAAIVGAHDESPQPLDRGGAGEA